MRVWQQQLQLLILHQTVHVLKLQDSSKELKHVLWTGLTQHEAASWDLTSTHV